MVFSTRGLAPRGGASLLATDEAFSRHSTTDGRCATRKRIRVELDAFERARAGLRTRSEGGWAMMAFLSQACDRAQSLAPAGPDARHIADLFWWMSGSTGPVWLLVMALSLHTVRHTPTPMVIGGRRKIVVWKGVIVPTVPLTVLLTCGLTMLPPLPGAGAARTRRDSRNGRAVVVACALPGGQRRAARALYRGQTRRRALLRAAAGGCPLFVERRAQHARALFWAQRK